MVKWQDNEEILINGLKCLALITHLEKPPTLGLTHLIEFLFTLIVEKYDFDKSKSVIITDIRSHALKILANLQPQEKNVSFATVNDLKFRKFSVKAYSSSNLSGSPPRLKNHL